MPSYSTATDLQEQPRPNSNPGSAANAGRAAGVARSAAIALGVTLALSAAAAACARREAGTASLAATTQPAPSSSAAGARRELEVALAERRGEREQLIREALAERGVNDPRVLGAMRRVPRHRFVPEAVRGEAYADRPLPIGWGQTISQPHVVAMMTEAAAPRPTDRCLEIGTGSGYQAAVLSELCGSVHSIEYVPALAAFGKQNLASLGYPVKLRSGDGYGGWPEAAPFDVIVVTAAPERVPAPLLEQLAIGGRLVVPVGAVGAIQKLEVWRRERAGSDEEAFERRELADVRFVPFVGKATE